MRPLDLGAEAHTPSPHPPVFVGRADQLAALHKWLGQALAGEGQIVFVAGEAGAGKTALLQRFAQTAHARHPDLLAIWGQSNAFAGSGDPYLPFRQALSLLLGESRRGFELGLFSQEEVQRLWSALPGSVDALLSHAPDLIDAFFPGADLLARTSAATEGEPDWLTALRFEVEKRSKQPTDLNRKQLQEQTLAFLRGLCTRRPLLLVLDDLHWADADSVSLLFHLARSLAGLRLLVVGAYRPEEIDIGRDGRPHPLKFLLAETKRLSGIEPINLNRLSEPARREFVAQLVDSQRNQLGADFRQALFAHTEGHALFTVEVLDELRTHAETSSGRTNRAGCSKMHPTGTMLHRALGE